MNSKISSLVGFAFLLTTLSSGMTPPVMAAAEALSPVFQPQLKDEGGGEYRLKFKDLPGEGDRLRLQGLLTETNLEFPKPRSWSPNKVKAEIHFRASSALVKGSFLTLQVNGTNVGSVPLNVGEGKVQKVAFDIPADVIKDFNEVKLRAQQKIDEECIDPMDPTLWTEILPESSFSFNYELAPVALDFSQYPYPFLDNLSLQPNQIAYLQPKAIAADWLTSASRLQASVARLANFQPLQTRVVVSTDAVKGEESLVIIGTAQQQPDLAKLKLPFTLKGHQWLDEAGKPIAPESGILMLTTTPNGQAPVLVATGNGAEGVAKATQFLAQSRDRDLATSHALIVDDLPAATTPDRRDWPRHLPADSRFQLKDLTLQETRDFEDVTVRGAFSSPVAFDFRALPDDRFLPGSQMKLAYSYGPQVNPRTSTVEVLLDGVAIAGEDLSDQKGGIRETLNVELPADRITPTSKLQVAFRLKPGEAGACRRTSDDHLWGTLHGETTFNLKRDTVVSLPDLQLMHVGFPFGAPQDLSDTVVVVPDQPSATDLETLLVVSDRLGRLSRAEGLELVAQRSADLTEAQRQQANLIAIGTQENFPLAEQLPQQSLKLRGANVRQWGEANGQIHSIRDQQGVISEMISPWNRERVILSLSAQSEAGLQHIQNVFREDDLFFQLQSDTALVTPKVANAKLTPGDIDEDDYELKFLNQQKTRQIEKVNPVRKVSYWMQGNWMTVPIGLLMVGLGSYGLSSGYLYKSSPKSTQKSGDQEERK